MAKQQFVHVTSLEKYVPGYTDRAYSWIKVYCRDTHDRKTGRTFRDFLHDKCLMRVDETDKSRYLSLILREVYLGRPVELTGDNLSEMGWNVKIRSKRRTLRKLLLHNLVQMCDSDDQSCAPQRSEAEEEAKGKRSEAEGKQPDGPLADVLAPDFPSRFRSALRSLIIPRTKGDITILLRIGEWVQAEIVKGADKETICKAVLERAAKAKQQGHNPMALLTSLLQDELGYPRS